MKEHRTVFDRPYDKDKTAEGLAVAFCAASGLCLLCKYRAECESNRGFAFPEDAYCAVRKREILKSWAERTSGKENAP